LAHFEAKNLEISGFPLTNLQISIKGIVQGVGFRPFVYSLAQKYNINGKVWNTSSGVEIQVSGQPNAIAKFLHELHYNPPTLARIDQLESFSIDTVSPPGFEIKESQSNSDDFMLISPDISICMDCQRELFNPHNRRFRYPFINCTNCGPRLTIITDIPYDRPKTTMAEFELCPECREDYGNPADRRFHAQPIACPRCGPSLVFRLPDGQIHYKEDALSLARESLKNGRIIAIKGLGGYHIACDASNDNAVKQLISRKHRSEKPLALMAFDESIIAKFCKVTPSESQLLKSIQHPIVLLEKKMDCSLPDNIAPNQKNLGFMLPYTPLHLLLLEPEPDFPKVLVMTSGNISEEPIAHDDEDAFKRLSPLVDGFLTHNRSINTRVDDSVGRIFENRPYPIRRSRGYAPNPIVLPGNVPEMLACGAELKNTFALSRENYAFVSHHIGDLENYETLRAFESGIEHFQRLFNIKPQFIVCDLHPDYLSSTYAMSRALKEELPLVKVQHHHAHLSSCLVDNHLDSKEPVIGIILDGTGFGSDGSIWGGEFLLGNHAGFSRPIHLASVPLPGGDSSIRQPAKIGLSYLIFSGVSIDNDLPPVAHFSGENLNLIQSQMSHGINCPLTSSMGRLFDAVSSIIGIRQSVTYEAQAAIDLENCCDKSENGVYTYAFENGVINTRFIIKEIVEDWRRKENKGIISAKFHNTVARICLDASLDIRKNNGVATVALSGGVWQNITLLQKTKPLLEENGFTVLIHNQVPSNDGGISLGQLMVASTIQSI
jgi:hydrogenase maturation protein HypF